MRLLRATWILGLLIMSNMGQARPLEIETLLSRHNAYRQELGIPPLQWSDTLAQSAQQWADHLAQTNSFQHSQTGGYGENLWMGTAGAYSQQEMVDSWASEKKDFIYGTFPNTTTGGVVGHYTQIVWRNTTEVGCALVTANGNDYLVCQYNPAGNYIGQKPY